MVVHLWVEGIFEVFATAIVAALFVKMGLLRRSVAATSVLLATIIFLAGGVLGTFHHMYFSGTPTSVIALGAVFSALEVVPLVVVGFEAYNRSKVEHLHEWQKAYRWPFAFFASVLVWNVIGAGCSAFSSTHRWRSITCRAEHDADPCACGLIRRLRHAGHRSDPFLYARIVSIRRAGATGFSRHPSGPSTSGSR